MAIKTSPMNTDKYPTHRLILQTVVLGMAIPVPKGPWNPNMKNS
jgi:hypothetical protein